MKYLLNLLYICFLFSTTHAKEVLVIPPGIQYKKALPEANKAAKEMLKKLFSRTISDQDLMLLFENRTLICGPGLWYKIKDQESLSSLDKGKVFFQVPILDSSGNAKQIQQLEGKLFQSSDEVLLFWKAFLQKTDFSNFKIRKLNPEELKVFWSMISFDITEPLFILESLKHKILVVFSSPTRLKIMWIDDYQNISFKKQTYLQD